MWRLESEAVVAFTVIGLVGVRVPIALIIGYPLHGIWDVLHELHAHGGRDVFGRESNCDSVGLRRLLCHLRFVPGVVFLYAPQPMACCLGASRTVERLIGRLDCGDWFFVEVGVPEQLSIWHSGERDTLRDSRIAGK